MRSLLASPLGFLIGLSLGALGGGGSILAVPALVYGAGEPAKAATSTSLVLVLLTSLIGIVPHLRAGRVRLGAGVLFGLAGVGGSLVGSRLNHAVDPDALLLAFAGLMLVAAAAMWRKATHVVARSVGAAVARPTLSGVDAGTVARVLLAGTGVGLLTGFFGVGGGFVIVPALVLALRFEMPEAVGTSLVVIAINAVVALSMRMGSGTVIWADVVPFAVASLAGVVVGTRLARRKNPVALQKAFVGLLVVVAVYTAANSVLALT